VIEDPVFQRTWAIGNTIAFLLGFYWSRHDGNLQLTVFCGAMVMLFGLYAAAVDLERERP